MPSFIARCSSATAIISCLCRTIPKIGNGCFGRAERCIAFLHTFGTAVMRQTARWERSPVSRWRAGSQGLHDPPPVRTLSVQYAETTDGVLPVQVGLSVHSLSCGRLCLPQVRGSPESPRILPKPSWMRSVQVRSSAIHILSPKVLCGYYPHTTPKPPMGCCLFRSGFRHLLTYPFVAEPRKGLDDLKYGHENVRPSMKVSPVLCGGITFCRVSLSFPLIICTDTVRTTCRNQRNAARSGRAFGTTHQPDET